MSVAAAPKPVDGRSTDIVTLPRATLEQSWMDVHALAFEIRDTLGDAHRDLLERRDPREHLFAADRRVDHLSNYARRHAAEAAGITFISPGQQELPLHDGCLTDDGASA